MSKSKEAADSKKASAATAAFLSSNGATGGDDDLLATKAEVASYSAAVDMEAIDWKNLERHPLSEKYGPPISDDEMIGLAADIEANGQHEVIKLYEGKVLAGWSRYRACRAKGIVPRLEIYTGKKPEAAAFGTNIIRRRLSSIAKAFMGAQFYLATGAKQIDIAKQCAVSLNRLNQCAQLLKLDTDEARRACKTLQENPEVTTGAFEEMLAECGIVRSNPKPATSLQPVSGGSGMDDDDDNLDDLSLDDDLTGGAIDGLTDIDDDLGGNDEGDETGEPKTPRRKEIGEGAAPLPAAGSRNTSPMTKPTETPVSKLAKFFNQLPPGDRVQFVSFAWKNLHGAVQQAVSEGKVIYTAPENVPAKKAKGSDYKKQVDAVAPPKEKKPQPPALAAAAAARKAAKENATDVVVKTPKKKA